MAYYGGTLCGAMRAMGRGERYEVEEMTTDVHYVRNGADGEGESDG